MVHPTPAYHPALIRGVKLNYDNPLHFDFIVDRGQSGLEGDAFKEEADKLIKYFLASLTTPERDIWVNLSPYEKTRIVPESFGQTEMGRDLLAQDYLLKQLTASLMYPDEALGKEFWERVHQKAQAMYGSTAIPLNTFNKVWIVPDKAVVYENGGAAFIVQSHLKVMLEQDYKALAHAEFNTPESKESDHVLTGVTADVVRKVLIPEIEKEVNTGKNFANLRQVFQSLILATWYKKRLRESLVGRVYVDQNKTTGVDVQDKEIKDKIYNQYIQAFKKGVYNFIREEYDPATDQMIPRKYFSGGFTTELDGETLEQRLVVVDKASLANQPADIQTAIRNTEQGMRGSNFALVRTVLTETKREAAAVTPATDAAMMTAAEHDVTIINEGRMREDFPDIQSMLHSLTDKQRYALEMVFALIQADHTNAVDGLRQVDEFFSDNHLSEAYSRIVATIFDYNLGRADLGLENLNDIYTAFGSGGRYANVSLPFVMDDFVREMLFAFRQFNRSTGTGQTNDQAMTSDDKEEAKALFREYFARYDVLRNMEEATQQLDRLSRAKTKKTRDTVRAALTAVVMRLRVTQERYPKGKLSVAQTVVWTTLGDRLNNPLAGLLMNLELLSMGQFEQQRPEFLEQMKESLKEFRRRVEFLNTMEDFKVHENGGYTDIVDTSAPAQKSGQNNESDAVEREGGDTHNGKNTVKDKAMLDQSASRQNTKEDPVGGINFNPELLDLQIKRDDKGIPLPLPQQPLKNIHINGFIPVIINIQPATNVPFLMGRPFENIPSPPMDTVRVDKHLQQEISYLPDRPR